MFVLDEDMNAVALEPKKFISVLHSINEPKIAAADRPAEPTQAYVCMLQEEGGELTAHILLYLVNSRVRVTYSWDEGHFSKGEMGEVEEEALDFVENMGFMMDNLNVAKMNESQRDEALAKFPVFQFGASEDLEELHELEELVEELEPVSSVVEPESDIFPAEAVEESSQPLTGVDLDSVLEDDKSLALMESEFVREGIGSDDELESAVAFLDPVESSKGVRPTLDPSKLKSLVRFLASF